VAADGKVGFGTGGVLPTHQLQVQRDQDANTFMLVRNATNGLNANAVVRTQADTAMQNFQSHASSRTLVRWGVPLGGWNEFLAVTGNGLAMGTLGNAPFILGTGTTARMSFDGDSNVISFGGGGQYDGNSFNDASSRALKQEILPLGPDATIEALAGLEPVTFAYTGAPGGSACRLRRRGRAGAGGDARPSDPERAGDRRGAHQGREGAAAGDPGATDGVPAGPRRADRAAHRARSETLTEAETWEPGRGLRIRP
jgi:hypothetical protein